MGKPARSRQPHAERDRTGRSLPVFRAAATLLSGCRRDRDPDRDRPCCPGPWCWALDDPARSRRRRARRPCCLSLASDARAYSRRRPAGRTTDPRSCIFWPGVLSGMRWPELWASASALVAISRPAAAAIDKGLIIIEGGLLRSLGFHCGSPAISADLGRSASLACGNAGTRHRVPSPAPQAQASRGEPYCRGDMDCAQSRLRARVPSRA